MEGQISAAATAPTPLNSITTRINAEILLNERRCFNPFSGKALSSVSRELFWALFSGLLIEKCLFSHLLSV
jgi:hypothetical protein